MRCLSESSSSSTPSTSGSLSGPEIGRIGEEAAAQYLTKNGFQILYRNWSCKSGELDIICRDTRGREELVFVEVKARIESGCSYRHLFDNIHRGKQRKLLMLCEIFLRGIGRRYRRSPRRIDVIGVTVSSAGVPVDLKHLRAAVGYSD